MMKQMLTNSYLFGSNAPFIEELYESYLDNPASVAPQWREYFDNLQNVPGAHGRDVPHFPIISSFAQRAKGVPVRTVTAPVADKKQVSVLQMINAYRFLGNQWAQLDPLKRVMRKPVAELDPAYYGFTEADLGQSFNTGSFAFGPERATLREIIDALRETYCGSIGAEYMYMTEVPHKRWVQSQLEPIRSTPQFDATKKKHLLERVTAAETMEKYLHTKFVGQKRFSLEGGESTIVSLDELINSAGALGVQEIVIGMAHRGRLNVLVNTLGKAPADLFSEFEGKHGEDLSAGDVKYHQGFSSDIATPGGPVHVTVAFNPSHLEIVNPVVEGSVYARQHRRGDEEGNQVLPVLIHGDAAVAGQGVVQETLNLSQTRGYGTGGTVHIVINNQIGFTTSDPRDTRSTIWCTDVMKMVDAPIFHVNGDDPEAVALVTRIALDFRMQFKKDVVIDIICFRRLGHNEQDEPMVTQPLMYKKIAAHPGTRRLYADKLVTQGVIGAEEPEQMIREHRAALDRGELLFNPGITNFQSQFAVSWKPFLGQQYTDEADTRVPIAELKRLTEQLTTIPESYVLHSRVQKIVEDRRAMGQGRLPLDWGMGENLAYASLLVAGYGVRVSGEDCGRGTFFHRHAVFHDQNRERWDAGTWVPLQHLQDGQAPFIVIDSVLSEEAVLGFEYGYATAEPNELVIWEAQFGDFANGAQVVIDQFISSGEAKWGRQNGLVMLLPHGYEGQGPEHSSARLERYMQLCAEYNMQVCVPSTPAQIFHLLRRQMIRKLRKPLIVMTPKSLLRHKEAVSPLDDLANGRFQTVIGELDDLDAKKVTRIAVCSGKLFYELLAARREKKIENVAILRLEQLYPFPDEAFAAQLKLYPKAKELVWVQEEPLNQGAWYASRHHFAAHLRDGKALDVVARPGAASPAVGYFSKHQAQQKVVIDSALIKTKN
jgi:2-oxoglutarate dehydrogenase E1 component